jgi:cytidylate kinase
VVGSRRIDVFSLYGRSTAAPEPEGRRAERVGPAGGCRPTEPTVSAPAVSTLDDLVVAIDGPSGSGKSTVARGVASRLGLPYLDTGATYRALTWLVLRRGVDVADPTAVADLAKRWRLEISTDPTIPRVLVDGADVTSAIRSPEVTGAVSAVSAVPEVRARLVALQREIAGSGGVVAEGRDTGTVVFPQAPVKVYLTASGSARAERRALESVDEADASVLAATRADLERRDRLDSTRATSPLTRAPDALEIDTTTMSVDEAVDAVVEACAAVVPLGSGRRGR